MGMPVTIDVRDDLGDAGRRAIDDVVAWLHDVNRAWSTHRDDSVITRFARGEVTVEQLPEEMHEVLDHCELLSVETNGAFDIHVPAPNGTRLETSGYVKGWAIQRAAELLEARGARNFCVNAGGDLVVRGVPEPDAGVRGGWRIGIRHPDDPTKLARVLELSGTWAVATSGTYERGAHIIDPRDGTPADSIRSVTVIGSDLTLVDVYATALFVMGVEGLTWLSKRAGFDAYVITKEGECIFTPGFARFVGGLPTGAPRR
jgi:thiamine biosynthesis lipoprotein